MKNGLYIFIKDSLYQCIIEIKIGMVDDFMLSLFDIDGGSFLDDLIGLGGGQSMDSNFMGQGMLGDQII